MTKGIKQMEALGFTTPSIKHDNFVSGIARQFIRYDDDGFIVDVINYFYTKENGVEVYTNSLKYGCGSRLDKSLIEAILLNLNELENSFD